MDMKLTKQKIRNTILMKLKTQKEENRNKKSSQVKNKLFRNRVFKKAKTVMFYMSFGGEVNTVDMIKAAQKIGKTVVVPVCGRNRMMSPCVLKDKGTLLRGPYGIREPALKKPVNLKSLDLVIVPGLAFDKQGRRLGRGKGYYDRFLSKISKHSIALGLAYDFQILPFIPTTEYDVEVQKVIFA
jgi:5-formyltetrahydrofolate cyclo-ligase